MEKSSPKFRGEQDFKINNEVDKNKPLNAKTLNSIEVPDLILRDCLRIFRSKHVKVD
ncbi:MAG: hypothetical protein KGD74_06215 [Candidatus Lokiarchaeota archaeon]|nr:hypothetical protein [Candidatus Lokiarchaeota archaeon]